MRYNRSPSNNMDASLGGYAPQHHAPPPPPPPSLSRSKGITTMTTMTISNLSDTVSKNDIAVSYTPLCVCVVVSRICWLAVLLYKSLSLSLP